MGMKRKLDQEYYLGTIHQSYFGYAYNKNIRKVAASGGLTTEILQYCLIHKHIQGALVSRSVIVDGALQSESKIIENPEELLMFTGSVYFPISIKEYIQQIREFQGKIAIDDLMFINPNITSCFLGTLSITSIPMGALILFEF